MIAVRISSAVPWSFIHLFNFWVLISHCFHALSAWHRIMWLLSSTSLWHQGQTVVDLWPCLAMFFLCAKWPVMCLVTHLRRLGVLLLIACSRACRSNSLWGWIPCGSLVSQYHCAGGPFITALSVHWWCLMIFLWLMRSCHGSNGRGCSGSAGLTSLMLPLAAKLVSIFNHASRDSTVG